MKKKKKIISIIFAILVCLIGSFWIIYQSNSKQDTAPSVSISSQPSPSAEKLENHTGGEKKEFRIITVYFDDRKTAILEDAEENEIRLPITISNKKEKTFSLSNVQGSPNDLIVGQTISVNIDNGHYYYNN